MASRMSADDSKIVLFTHYAREKSCDRAVELHMLFSGLR